MSIATGQINIQNIDETLNVSLSSDSHVFPGAVSTALAGQVDVEVEAFLGAKQIDCSIDAVTPTPPKGLTITVVPTQSKTKIVRFAAATNLSQSGTYNIYVNAAGTTVKKTFSYAIAFKGNTGSTGPKGATGNTGPRGATGVGVSSITEYYLATAASSGVTSGAGAWSTTVQTITADKKYLWNYERVNFDDGTSSPTLPVIIGVYGDKGDTGKTGNTGRSITKIEEFYLTTSASSGVVRTSGAWLPNPTPTTPTNKYLWNYERITWSSGTTPTYVEPFIIGIHGDEGKKGDPGKGISSATVTYQAGSSGTVAPTGTWSTTIPAVAANQYLWTRTVITYTDNKTSTAYAVGKMGAQGPQGNTGPTGNGIDSTKVTYQASSSGTVAPTGTWQTTVPSVADNQYLWTRVVINYTSGSPTTSYSVGKMGAQGPQGARGPQGVQGATGKQGPIGDTGTSVSSIVEWYLATNLSSGVTTSTDGWKTTMQSMTATKKYLWNYEVINFSDGSSSPTIPVIIGVYGNTGATGRALTGITEYYLASATASGVTRPSTDGTSGWTTTMQPTSISKPYLWNYEKLTWSVTPTTTYVEPIVIGVHGPQGPQGPQGSRGPQGIQGPIGPEGKATYTWIKYADTPTTGMENFPDGKKYMGIAHNKPTATESTAYGDYTWSLIQGPQGNQGVQGPIGPNGQPTYTWIKYADTATGSGMDDSPTGKRFLGLAHNKTTATESTKASDYKWSPLYDNVVVGGRNLLKNSDFEKTMSPREFMYYVDAHDVFEPLVGQEITISFDAKANIDGQLRVYGGNNARYAIAGSHIFNITTEYKRYSLTAVINDLGNTKIVSWIDMYSTYGTGVFATVKNMKIEKGNIPTDWTPAPEDIEERLVSHDARIDTNEREIALRATTAAVGSIDTRLKAAELKVTADAITSTVRKSTDYINDQGKKVSTNEIISKINQSAEKITIEASKINIKGKVTFESFDSSTAAEINSKAKTFVAKPTPPYSAGDIWKDGTTTKISKTTRSSGSYVAADWEKTGDVTSANKAADTAKVGGTAATTVVTGATAGSAAKTATDRWTYTGKTTINGGQIQADTVTATQIKAKTITASEIAANTITVDQLASSVGGSLNLSSNEAITSRVTSTQMNTALNGKEDSLYKQASAPAHKVGRLWLDTSVTPNVLKRSTGSAWVKATPTTAAEVGAYSTTSGSALATRVYNAEQSILPGKIKSTVEAQVTANGSTVLATKSDITQTERDWTAKFSSIGGTNMLTNSSFSENLNNTGATSGVSIVLKDGRNCARVNGSFGRADTVSWSVLGKVEPGEKYTMSGWVKLENIKTGPTNYTIMYYTDGYSNGTWYGWGSKQISTNTSSWQYVTHTFTAPSASILNSATSCKVYLYTRDFTGTIYFRNLQLERGEIATDWTPHPDELYTGVTKIDKDGVTVGIEGETIESNLGFDGVRIKDGVTEIASFTGSGAVMNSLEAESISGDVVNTLNSSVTLNVGKTAGQFATVEQALASTGNAKYLGLDVVLTINIYDILNEDVSIAGFTGAGKVVVNLHGRINGHLWTEGNSCLLEIYGKTTGNVIKGTGYPYLSRGDSGVYVDNIVADAMNSANSVGFMIREGSTATLRGADTVNSQDGIMVRDGAIAQITYARGNVTRYGVYSHSGVAFLKATVPTSGNTAIARSLGGFVVQDGTPTQENSRFSPPPTQTVSETRTFNHTDIYTYSVKYGAKSTHYGKAAAQNRWDTSMTQMKGRIVFGSSVYSFIAGRNSGTTPTVKIRLRRQNSSHGTSASVKPTPEWSGAPSFGGATRGNWTAWATIPYTLFKSSGYEFSFYNESTGNSYAIWDRAEVQITRRITQ